MSYVKVEPSGCSERNGMVQIRLAMYLESEDYGYEKHHVKINEIWQDNPFHNHFIQVDPDVSDEEIMDIAEAFLYEAYIKWACDERPDLRNDVLPFKKPSNINGFRIMDCNSRVESIKAIKLERKI